MIDWHDFDVLITDLNLADGPGCGLLEYLRNNSPTAEGIVQDSHYVPSMKQN